MKVLSFATFALVALSTLAGADAAQERNLRSAMTNHQQHHQAANHHQAAALEAHKVAQQHPAMEAHHQQHQQHQAANNHHQGVMEARFQQHQAAKRPALEAHKANQQHAAMEARRQQRQAVNNNQHHQAANHQQQYAAMELFHDKLAKAMERMKTKKNAKPALMEAKNGKNQLAKRLLGRRQDRKTSRPDLVQKLRVSLTPKSLCSQPHLSSQQRSSLKPSRHPAVAAMKVITLAMLALAALAAGVSAAAIPKERNLRGSMKMHHLEAHKASHVAHDVMPAMPAMPAMETRSSNGKPKQKVKKGKAGKKSSMEAKPTGARLPPPPPLPMKDGKVDIAAFMKKIEVGVPPPGGMQQPGAGNAPPLSNSGASFDKRPAMVPKPVAKSGGVAMEAHDSLDSYFQALKKANEASPPAYNQEAQAEAAMADNNNNLQHAVSMESDHVFSKGTAFEVRLHNQKSTKGKKGKKAL